MNPEKIEQHIDRIVRDLIQQGYSLIDVCDHLNTNIKRHKKRDSFIPVSKRYLINNWTLIHVKKRLTTMYVIHSLKRMKDIKWLIENESKLNQNTDLKLFNLIVFKDKIKNKISL